MKAKLISTVAGFVKMPGYVKMALALVVLAAATSMTSCCPPGGGGYDGGEPSDTIWVK